MSQTDRARRRAARAAAANPQDSIPFRPLMPPNEQGELLCGRMVPVQVPGVLIGWRPEYVWADLDGRVLRPAVEG